MKKQRLDTVLVARGFYVDEQEALRGVLAHEVRVDDVYATSAAILIDPDTADIFVKGKRGYVSRGGYKLQKALDAFGEDVRGKSCIDIGSSTGGFCDCLLQAGAASVACVDVNYGQLAWKLRTDERVRVFERTNIRTSDPAKLGAPFDILVADVSFIGLALLIPAFVGLCKPGSVFIGLIKPQFESKFGETDGGVVVDESVRIRTVEEVKEALANEGFMIEGVVVSPIKGPKGNVEYLVKGVYTGK
ncbi:MAG: TlyA family RNA methyltransferase [Eggerthellaceae bacterium]|nr:TlyA family RNA methyltransferase [Eggerthellaceae bacterium]